MRNFKSIRNMIYFVYATTKFFSYEAGHGHGTFFYRLKMILNGFFSESGIIYDFKKFSKKDYISDWDRLFRLSQFNTKYSPILDNKLIFESFFKEKLPIISSLAFIKDGVIRSIKTGDIISIFDLLLTEKILILKPIFGGGGEQISEISRENQLFLFNGNPISEEHLSDKIKSHNDFLVQKKIIQDGIASDIYPHSLNTIRILTKINNETRKAEIVSAVFRMGHSLTGKVDNWTGGGISASIHLETGIIGKGVIFHERKKIVWCERHPNTNFLFTGSTIPFWNKIKSEIVEISNSLPYLPYIGWDVIPCSDGYYILEGNSNSDLNLLQVHHPLKARYN